MSELTNHLSDLELDHCKELLVENGVDVVSTSDKTVTRVVTTGDHLAKLWQLKAERK